MSRSRSLPIINPPPPVEDRLVCPGCSKHRKPIMSWAMADGSPWKGQGNPEAKTFRGNPEAKTFRGRYEGYGAFCTLRCATRYANWAFKQLKSYLSWDEEPKP